MASGGTYNTSNSGIVAQEYHFISSLHIPFFSIQSPDITLYISITFSNHVIIRDDDAFITTH